MNKKLLIAVIVVVAIIAVILYTKGTQPGSPMPSMSMNVSPSPTPRPSTGMTPTPTPSPTATVRAGQTFTVSIDNFAFAPASLTVHQGDTVIFKNMDATIHTVTAVNGSFDSGTIGTNQQWSLTTTTLARGTYAYRCTLHPSMQGTLVVQ